MMMMMEARTPKSLDDLPTLFKMLKGPEATTTHYALAKEV